MSCKYVNFSGNLGARAASLIKKKKQSLEYKYLHLRKQKARTKRLKELISDVTASESFAIFRLTIQCSAILSTIFLSSTRQTHEPF